MEANNSSEEQICLLVANINEFVLAHSITLNTKPPGETPERWDKIKKSLQLYLQKLIDIGEDVKIELNESRPEWSLVQKHLDTLIGIFLETTKAVLVQQMKVCLSIDMFQIFKKIKDLSDLSIWDANTFIGQAKHVDEIKFMVQTYSITSKYVF